MAETLTEQVIRLTKLANIEGYNIDNPDYVYEMTQYQLEQLVKVTKNEALAEIQAKIGKLLTKNVIK